MTIDEILERFGTSVSPVATLKNMKNPLVKTENINQAKADLIELIKSSKPEKTTPHRKTNVVDVASSSAFNKALDVYETNLLQAIGEIK